MKHNLYCYFAFGLLFVHSISVFAADADDMTLLFGSSLETLTTITIASKKEETLNRAPGVVAVITADEIQRYGARNLRDVLDRQTSMQIIGSNLFAHNKNAVRGIAKNQLDNNVLILLNGRPIRESTNNSVNADIYAYFPLSSLSKIEIIRGPGSVLYGTNAFSGVVNLVTKKAPETASGSLALTYGSFDHKQGQVSGGGTWGDLEFFGAAQGLYLAGDDHHNVMDQFGNAGTYKTGRDGEQVVMNLRYKGLTVNAFHSNTVNDNAGVRFTLPSDVYEYKRHFIDVGYEHNISDNWSVTANASYHKDKTKTLIGPGATVGGTTGYNHLFELATAFTPLEGLDLVAGGTYREYSSVGTTEFDTYSHSFYTQFDYQLLDWLNVIGGLQYNKQESVDRDFSPRLALIAQFDEYWGGKVLYGKAYREASGVERFVNFPGLVVGDPSISPETIKTIDVQLFYEAKNLSFAATYYHGEHEDLVTLVAGSPSTIINHGGVRYDGLELEGKWQVNRNWQLIGNLSYQTNEDEDGTDDANYSPDLMVKTGVSYDSLKGYQLSLFNSYFAESTLKNEDVGTVSFYNKSPDSYNLLTANLNVNVGKFFNKPSLSKVTFSLYGDNLLDEDIYFPSIRNMTVNSIPHHASRGLYGTIKIDF
jgi:outer membrane receptor for ferrienterochelin and colicin